MLHRLFMWRHRCTPFRVLHSDLVFTEDMEATGTMGRAKGGIMANSERDTAAMGIDRMGRGDAVTIDVDLPK